MEKEKVSSQVVFNIFLALWIFFKIIFIDRYGTQILRIVFLDYELLISIETDNLRPSHEKMVGLIFDMVNW